ncbi:Gins complex like protein [Nitzschia inconspicua]|uniref:Gins complex like protein n=1 Tax=Nitzschia inconspicua TaxID=303405 RepID=A0A9K3KQC7_9STRA|nr:Gins complex like protein [Nitzschia inconspicua]
MVRLSLCNQSSFCSENELVTIIPSFNYDNKVPLISSPDQTDIGPFQAGLPTVVPLWIAKTLYQRKLAQIELPEWLASEQKLVEILQEERESALLTNQLPFYYYEIARSLNFCVPKQTQVVLQDVVALRSDKLRQHFHELSRTDLQEQPLMKDDEDQPYELPMISVTGIASHEINKVGPFLQRAFSDYGFLTKRAIDEGMNKASAGRQASTSGDEDLGKQSQSQESSRKVSMVRSRLRRFRS